MMKSLASHLTWIDQQHDRMVTLLERFVNLNTGTYNVPGHAAFRQQLLPLLQELSPNIDEIPLKPHTTFNDNGQPESRPLGQAISLRSPPRTGPRVLLNIHMDTVYAATDPFQSTTRLDPNTLRGPGVTDAKGGLLILIFSLLAFERSPFAQNLHWEILINPDEEIGSPGSSPLLIEAAKRNDLALLFEPATADGGLVSARKGAGTFTFIVHGRAAHAGRDPQNGRNAIHALAALITKLAALQSEIPGGGVIVNTGSFQASGPSNIVPDFALARVNARIDTPQQQTAFEQRLRHLLTEIPEGITIDLHGSFGCPPKVCTAKIEQLLHHLKTCGDELKLNLTWKSVGGVSDGNRLAAAGLINVDSLGPRGGNIHTPNEFILLDSLTERTRLTTLFLMRLAAGDIKLG